MLWDVRSWSSICMNPTIVVWLGGGASLYLPPLFVPSQIAVICDILKVFLIHARTILFPIFEPKVDCIRWIVFMKFQERQVSNKRWFLIWLRHKKTIFLIYVIICFVFCSGANEGSGDGGLEEERLRSACQQGKAGIPVTVAPSKQMCVVSVSRQASSYHIHLVAQNRYGIAISKPTHCTASARTYLFFSSLQFSFRMNPELRRVVFVSQLRCWWQPRRQQPASLYSSPSSL